MDAFFLREEKKQLKEEKLKEEEKYMWAIVDGVKQKDAPIPECPIPGHRWKEVRHDRTVKWLAFWYESINIKELKYVFFDASSSQKGKSDLEKYEKARILKDYIGNIRDSYTKNFKSQNMIERKIVVATYLIDRLSLSASNQKVI
ncbi:hypothetical protein SUGI_1169350 [Cryptomeria japonica]|nr:hypothetical protein SUGI_1169350 [Cryptomeria japonica]